MTEPTEPVEPTEPTEPTEPREESADEMEEHDEDNLPEHEREPEGEPEPPQEPQEPQGLSEKEIESRFEKLEKERQRHAKRVGEILEEEAQELVPCELCWPPAPGFRFPQMPEEQRSAVMTAIGFAGTPELEEAKDARQCPDCKGEGQVKTGSKVPGYDAMPCAACQGRGAVGERFAEKIVASRTTGAGVVVNGPQSEAPLSADREAARQAAQDAGFMVVDMRAPAPA